MSYGPIWQYQGRAGPVGGDPPVGSAFPWVSEHFLELLPLLVLGSFDAPPPTEPAIFTLPGSSYEVVEEQPFAVLGSFDAPPSLVVPVVLVTPTTSEPLVELEPFEILGSFSAPITRPPSRHYFDSTAPPFVAPPAPEVGWDHFEQGVTRRLNVVKRNSAFVTQQTTYDTADDLPDKNALHRQYVSGPLEAQSIPAQAVKVQIRAAEDDAKNNLFVTVKIYLITSSGQAVGGGTILAIGRDDVEVDTVLTNRAVVRTTSAVTASAGDRLCVEIGLGGDPGPAAGGQQDHDGSLRFGEAGGSDLPQDDSSTSDLDPWIEFLVGLQFAPEFNPPTLVVAPDWLGLPADEILGSFSAPFLSSAAPISIVPEAFVPFIERLPDEILGSFDRPLLHVPLVLDLVHVQPPGDLAPEVEEILGSFNAPQAEPAVVAAQPVATEDLLFPLPFEILGSFDAPPLPEVVVSTAWMAPTDPDLWVEDPPQLGSFSAMPLADGPRPVSWMGMPVEPPTETPEALGSFDSPLLTSVSALRLPEASEPPPLPALEEALGSFDSPLVEVVVVATQPSASEDLLDPPLLELLGSFDRPLLDFAPVLNWLPSPTPDFPALLPEELLGSFDRPLVDTNANAGWRTVDPGPLPELPAPQSEQWTSFVDSPEAPSLSWLGAQPDPAFELPDLLGAFDRPLLDFAQPVDRVHVQPPAEMLLPEDELLGSFDAPLMESAPAVNAQPLVSEDVPAPHPDEILGSFSAPLLSGAGVTTHPLLGQEILAPLEPESLGSFSFPAGVAPSMGWLVSDSAPAPLPLDPLPETWLSFVARDDGARFVSWIGVPVDLPEGQFEQLGSFSEPRAEVVVVTTQPGATSEQLPAQTFEVLGSFDAPPAPVVVQTQPWASQELVEAPTEELLGSFDAPLLHVAIVADRHPLAVDEQLAPEIDAILGSFDPPFFTELVPAGRHITGLDSSAAVGGTIKIIFNVDAVTFTLDDESAFSLAQNRFAFPAGNIDIPANSGIMLMYDAVSLRWRGIGRMP